MKEIKSNLWSGAVFLAFGIFVFAGSWWIPATTSDILGSRFFPRAVAVLIIVLSGVQILGACSALKKADRNEDKEKWTLNKPLFLTVAALFVYYILVLYIGFTVTSILYLLFQSGVLMSKEDFSDKRKMIIMIAVSVLTPIIINGIFWELFSIALPAGKIF
ncbi:MAG: tripartite tricarboxylate transporter TctB family protein [Eubacteriales bacterium]|nr:tripartite tricarboxylate transporter TctB family protein [Eubacteriales bacterium]